MDKPINFYIEVSRMGGGSEYFSYMCDTKEQAQEYAQVKAIMYGGKVRLCRPMWDQMREIARGNVEAHLSDAVSEDYGSLWGGSADAIYDEAYTLGFDALHDAGCPDDMARLVAADVARSYAQP